MEKKKALWSFFKGGGKKGPEKRGQWTLALGGERDLCLVGSPSLLLMEEGGKGGTWKSAKKNREKVWDQVLVLPI